VRLKRRPNLFESRTQVWREVGLGAEIDRGQAKRAKGGVVLVALAIIAVLIVFSRRRDLFPGYGTEVRIGTVIALVLLGTALARWLGQGMAPGLFRRLDPATAGTALPRRRSPSAAPSPRWSSVSPRSRRSATCSRAPC
jgi:hypothetical protein